MKRTDDNRGITLIALVITIIVLLILAGVSISMLSGDNGILQQARNASMRTEEESINEKIKLAAVDAMLRGDDAVSIESEANLQEGLKSQGITEATIGGNKTEGYTVTVNEKTYDVSSKGEVKESVPMITFILDGKEFTMPKGSTWEDFCERKMKIKISYYGDEEMYIHCCNNYDIGTTIYMVTDVPNGHVSNGSCDTYAIWIQDENGTIEGVSEIIDGHEYYIGC